MTKLGRYTLYSIETGSFALDGGAMFGIIPKVLWERKFAPDSKNRIGMRMRCLLLEGDGRLILIDNGVGQKGDAKFNEIFAVNHASSNLDDSLSSVGFSPADVTDVILTHLHFDHCGGSTKRTASGRIEVAFPDATFHVQRAHWDWAARSNLKEGASFLEENLRPIEESGRLSYVDGEKEILPGLFAHVFHGHTDAMQAIRLDGGERSLVFAADLLPTSHHLRPAWTMGYDIRPLVTIDEKGRFVETAIDRQWDIFFEHDPDTVVARLTGTAGSPVTTDIRPLHEL